MKKLLFFINTLEGGGAELVLTNIANELSGEYDVTVMTLIDSGVHRDKLCDSVKYKSIVKTRNQLLKRISIFLLSRVLPAVLVHKLFIGNNYDYEVAFLEGVPTKLISAAKTKKYAWVHIDLYNAFGIEKVHKSMKKHIDCYKKYDKIICVSENVKEAFTKRFGITENLEVKYNLLDDELIRSRATEPLELTDKFKIVSVGRLTSQKGYDRLLPIVKQLCDAGLDFELVLVGDGAERASLEAQVKELEISDKVMFTGFVDNPYKYMQSADLLVFPSRAEGYSTVVCEAIILGKPVVVSDCSGMREILGDSEFGIVTKNDEELCEAIKKMILNSDFRQEYAEKAMHRSKIFSKQARLREIEKLFED